MGRELNIIRARDSRSRLLAPESACLRDDRAELPRVLIYSVTRTTHEADLLLVFYKKNEGKKGKTIDLGIRCVVYKRREEHADLTYTGRSRGLMIALRRAIINEHDIRKHSRRIESSCAKSVGEDERGGERRAMYLGVFLDGS